MVDPQSITVAVIGTGVIGRSWARVFARAGCSTKLYDPDQAQVETAIGWIREDLAADEAEGVIGSEEAEVQVGRILPCNRLEDALRGAAYVQESGPEKLEIKGSLFVEMDRFAESDAVLATSTSGLDIDKIVQDLPGAARCIVAHPVNPPHVVPVVEVLPAKATSRNTVDRAMKFLHRIGQSPVRLNFYISGFLLNRMHLMGPFGVANTNADAGIREYFSRYGDDYVREMNDLGPTPVFDSELLEKLGKGTDAMTRHRSRAAIRRWRDRLVQEIRTLKRKYPHP
jgi:3-hydroxyacyl-CoA dehydrogenase